MTSSMHSDFPPPPKGGPKAHTGTISIVPPSTPNRRFSWEHLPSPRRQPRYTPAGWACSPAPSTQKCDPTAAERSPPGTPSRTSASPTSSRTAAKSQESRRHVLNEVSSRARPPGSYPTHTRRVTVGVIYVTRSNPSRNKNGSSIRFILNPSKLFKHPFSYYLNCRTPPPTRRRSRHRTWGLISCSARCR